MAASSGTLSQRHNSEKLRKSCGTDRFRWLIQRAIPQRMTVGLLMLVVLLSSYFSSVYNIVAEFVFLWPTFKHFLRSYEKKSVVSSPACVTE